MERIVSRDQELSVDPLANFHQKVVAVHANKVEPRLGELTDIGVYDQDRVTRNLGKRIAVGLMKRSPEGS